jgi:hypothetical protein
MNHKTLPVPNHTAKLEITRAALEQATASVDVHQVRSSYDAATDRLMLYLTDQPVGGISVPLDEKLFLLVAPSTQEIVGFQLDRQGQTVDRRMHGNILRQN